jgi:hypothetical protein
MNQERGQPFVWGSRRTNRLPFTLQDASKTACNTVERKLTADSMSLSTVGRSNPLLNSHGLFTICPSRGMSGKDRLIFGSSLPAGNFDFKC